MRNWAGNLEYSASEFVEPHSEEELQALIRSRSKLKVVGSRHSFSTIADTSGAQISMKHFNEISHVDHAHMTVKVAAGVTYAELARHIALDGYTLSNFASLPHISVVGAISTATHGSGVANPALSSAVDAISWIGGTGEQCYSDHLKPEFNGLVVSLGAIGIITEVKLKVVPMFELRQFVFDSVSFADIVTDFKSLMSSAYSVSLFTTWDDSSQFQVWVKTTEGSYVPNFEGTLATTPRHPVPGMPVENATEQLGVPGLAPDRLPHFRPDFMPSGGVELQAEYFVKQEDAPEALAIIKELSHLINPLLLVSEIRAISHDRHWMSPFSERDSIGIHFTWKQHPTEVLEVLKIIDQRLSHLHPRTHWGKLSTLSPEVMRSNYPKLHAFASLVEKYDPEAKFRNNYLEDLLGVA